jgi:hypothetical protein
MSVIRKNASIDTLVNWENWLLLMKTHEILETLSRSQARLVESHPQILDELHRHAH